MTTKTKGTKSSCTCDMCVGARERNPGWFTPEEAMQAIKAGYARRMMRDWYVPDEHVASEHDKIYVLAPASQGFGGTDAPEIPEGLNLVAAMFWCKGRCTFLNKGLCEIHDSGFKPLQCRDAFCCDEGTRKYDRSDRDSNVSVAKLWNTEEGRAIVRAWEAAVSE